MAKTSSTYNVFSATSAFFVWGGWSYYVNSDESSVIGLISGVTQGVASFVITLLVVFAVTKIYNMITIKVLKMVLPSIITVSCISILLVIVHSAVGTPHIAYTIVPSLTVAFAFCMFTTYSLRKDELVCQA
jgi:hypothetical protein